VTFNPHTEKSKKAVSRTLNRVRDLVVKCLVYAILPFYLFPHTDFKWVKLLLSQMGDADKPHKYAVLGFFS
jgi:hypothetical protein